MGKLGLILRIVNLGAVLAVLGLFVYTRLIFKRPVITESTQRQKIEKEVKSVNPDTVKGIITLEPISANLDSFTENGKEKVHYATLTMVIEIRDREEQKIFDNFRPMVMDKILSLLAKKKFSDLNQVQGRYVFRSQIVDGANEIMGAPVVTDVYFTDFLLQ